MLGVVISWREPSGTSGQGSVWRKRRSEVEEQSKPAVGSPEAMLVSFLFISDAKGIPMEVLKCGE